MANTVVSFTTREAQSIVVNVRRMTAEELAAVKARATLLVEAVLYPPSPTVRTRAKRVLATVQFEIDKRAGDVCANCAENRAVHATVSFPGDCRTFVPMPE